VLARARCQEETCAVLSCRLYRQRRGTLARWPDAGGGAECGWRGALRRREGGHLEELGALLVDAGVALELRALDQVEEDRVLLHTNTDRVIPRDRRLEQLLVGGSPARWLGRAGIDLTDERRADLGEIEVVPLLLRHRCTVGRTAPSALYRADRQVLLSRVRRLAPAECQQEEERYDACTRDARRACQPRKAKFQQGSVRDRGAAACPSSLPRILEFSIISRLPLALGGGSNRALKQKFQKLIFHGSRVSTFTNYAF